MKTLQLQLQSAVAGGLIAGLLGLASSLPAQSVSPVGTWDFVLSGDQKGVAHITFNSDFTLDGREIITIRPKAKPDPDPDPRVPGSGGPRVVDPPGTNSYFFGGGPVVGVWGYEDLNGRIFGIYNELAGSISLTNYVTFRGKQSGTRRLNLAAYTAKPNNRRFQLRGIPQTPLPDLTGRYVLFGRRDFEPYVSVFDLDPDPLAALPNQYMLTTVNPIFAPARNGSALLSRHGQLAIVSREFLGADPDTTDLEESVLFGLSGPYSVTKTKGTVTGVNELKERVVTKVIKIARPEVEAD